MNKIKLSLLLVVLMVLSVAGVASAETSNNNDVVEPPAVTAPAVSQENVPADLKTDKKISRIKNRGAVEIAKRVAALGKLKSKTQSSKLTDTQKTEIVSIVDTNVVGLTALGDQIKVGTDASSTKVLVQKIYTDFRIYAVVIPRIHALIALGQQSNFISRINDRIPKVQARIDAAKAKGKDVTARQAALDGAKTKLATVAPKITDLVTKTNSLKPADYPTTSKTVITEIRTGIKEVHNIFKQINQDFRTAK
ncbi:MAG: hypothetical protein WCO03_00840 [bacterium]